MQGHIFESRREIGFLRFFMSHARRNIPPFSFVNRAQNLPFLSLIIIFEFVWDKSSLFLQLNTRKSLK